MLAVPFAREEVLQAVGLESNGAVDEAIMVGAGVVPERVQVPERNVRRVLERAAAVVAGGLRQEPTLRCQAAMGLFHRVNGIVEMFEGVVRPEHADLAAEWPGFVEVGGGCVRHADWPAHNRELPSDLGRVGHIDRGVSDRCTLRSSRREVWRF